MSMFVKGTNKIKVFYRPIVDTIAKAFEGGHTTVVIYPVSIVGHGRWHYYKDETSKILEVCQDLKLRYERGNDSVRGGRLGEHIRIFLPG